MIDVLSLPRAVMWAVFSRTLYHIYLSQSIVSMARYWTAEALLFNFTKINRPVNTSLASVEGGKRIGLRKNFCWALLGNLIYQASQWLNLVVLAKLLSVEDVGRFAFALAICTPISAFASLNLRSVQVTDVNGDYRFGVFLALQMLSTFAALTLITAIAATSDSASIFTLIVVVGLGQAVVAHREVFIAFNIKYERMDKVAISKVMLGLGSFGALGLTIWATHNLIYGIAASQVAKLGVLLLWDIPATRKLVCEYTDESPRSYLQPIWRWRVMLRLAWLALPLALAVAMQQLFSNAPRYFIADWLSKEALGFFAAIMSLVLAGKTVVHAAGMSALPRLSRYYLNSRKSYIRLLFKLVMIGGVIGIGGIILAVAGGKPLLRMMFTDEYAAYDQLLILSMFYGLIDYIMSFLNFGATAMRRFKVQSLAHLTGMSVVIGACWLLIGDYGLNGAVVSLTIGRLAFGVVLLAVIAWGFRVCISSEQPDSSCQSSLQNADKPSVS